MALPIAAELPPLTTDADGVVRVAGTRVTLGTVVGAFQDGATAEEIVHRYPSLTLSDVYAVIAYYLRRRSEVDAYLRERHERGEMLRREYEKAFDQQGIRERLLARRAVMKSEEQ
jgi:uncharacterized protein (DUF433 family)